MERAEFNGKTIAEELGWSSGRVSRLLSGKRGGSAVEVAGFLAVCKVKGAERTRLLELTEEQNKYGWLQQYGSRLPKQVRTLIDHETSAIRIAGFDALVVPGLLQTGDYARAVIQEPETVPPDDIEDRVSARLARQSLLGRQYAPSFTFFVHEQVLRLPVGGSRVMSDQLHQLIRLSVRPNLTVRLIPTRIGAHPGINGSFRLMEFDRIKPVAYVETENASLFQEEREEIESYQRVLAKLDAKGAGRGTIQGADCHLGDRALHRRRGS